jgi:hypothetical protein
MHSLNAASKNATPLTTSALLQSTSFTSPEAFHLLAALAAKIYLMEPPI